MKAIIRWDGVCVCGCKVYQMDFLAEIPTNITPWEGPHGELRFLYKGKSIDAYEAISRRIVLIKEVNVHDEI